MTLGLVAPLTSFEQPEKSQAVATGLAVGRRVDTALAVEAVLEARKKLHGRISSVILLLGQEFSGMMDATLLAVARVAETTQITGCLAPGIFTELDWVVDAPAAAVMVFSSGYPILDPALASHENTDYLTFVAPSALDITWLNTPGRRLGAVAGDTTGTGPYRVWSRGRLTPLERAEIGWAGLGYDVVLASGLKPLSPLLLAEKVEGYELQSVHGDTAIHNLQMHLEHTLHDSSSLLPRLAAVFARETPEKALLSGKYTQVPLLGLYPERGAIMLARQLASGDEFFWAYRDPDAAVSEFRQKLAAPDLIGEPLGGFLFCCVGRGASFYEGKDLDWQLVKERFPAMPFLGFYGNAQIAPVAGQNKVLQSAAVLGLLRPNPSTESSEKYV